MEQNVKGNCFRASCKTGVLKFLTKLMSSMLEYDRTITLSAIQSYLLLLPNNYGIKASRPGPKYPTSTVLTESKLTPLEMQITLFLYKRSKYTLVKNKFCSHL